LPRIHRVVATIVGLVLLADAFVCGVLLVKAHNTDHRAPSIEEPVDALVVFYDRPDRFQRLEVAILALQDGIAEHLILVGGCRPGKGRFGAGDMARYAKAAGVAPERIHVDRGSFDTRTNLSEALEVADRNNWESIAFVSDPLHLRRIHSLAAADAHLVSISRGRSVVSPYGGGVLERVRRAQHEVVYWVLSAMLSEEAFNRLIKVQRTGGPSDEPVRCDAGLTP
jgi:DUF218 domain